MWVGKRVQREARNHDRPSGNVFRRGEPNSYEGATATESMPQHAVEFGGRSPGAKRSAAPLWVGQASSLMMRQQHKLRNVARQFATQPSQRGAAHRARPRGQLHRPLEERQFRKAKKIKQIGRPAQSIRRSWRQPTSRMEAVWCLVLCVGRRIFCDRRLYYYDGSL